MLWQHNKDFKGPCQYRLLDHTRRDPSGGNDPLNAPALFKGQCQTYREARGLLMRVCTAAQRSWRMGWQAGYKAGKAAK